MGNYKYDDFKLRTVFPMFAQGKQPSDVIRAFALTSAADDKRGMPNRSAIYDWFMAWQLQNAKSPVQPKSAQGQTVQAAPTVVTGGTDANPTPEPPPAAQSQQTIPHAVPPSIASSDTASTVEVRPWPGFTVGEAPIKPEAASKADEFKAEGAKVEEETQKAQAAQARAEAEKQAYEIEFATLLSDYPELISQGFLARGVSPLTPEEQANMIRLSSDAIKHHVPDTVATWKYGDVATAVLYHVKVVGKRLLENWNKKKKGALDGVKNGGKIEVNVTEGKGAGNG